MVDHFGAFRQFRIGGDLERSGAAGAALAGLVSLVLRAGSALALRRFRLLGAGAARLRRRHLRHRPASVAMGELTFTPSVPSGTRILPMRPSSTASNSIVALSVSISARMSPDLTVSPSLTSQLASLPSSMVGDRAGIRICVVIRRHIRVKFGEARFRAFGGEFGRGGDDLLDLLVHHLQVVFGGDAALAPASGRNDRWGRASRALPSLPRACGTWRDRTWNGRDSGRSSSPG